MALNPTGSGTHATRAMASVATTKAKEELFKEPKPFIKDPDTALKYLLAGDLKLEDNERSFELLSIVVMQLLQQTRFLAQVSEAFRALSYLISDL